MYTFIIHNLGDLDFGLSRPLTVNCDAAVGPPISNLLLVPSKNMWPTSAPLQGNVFNRPFKVTQRQM